MEIWKQIEEFPSCSVSTLGRIRGPLKIRKPHKNKFGYLQVHLSNGRHEAIRNIHRLVAISFLGPPPEGKKVNHKNGQKTDNRLGNLEYMTPKENSRHASKLFLMAFGERNSKAKLTDEEVKEIRNASGPAWRIAHQYRVSKSTIYLIRWRKTWPHI